MPALRALRARGERQHRSRANWPVWLAAALVASAVPPPGPRPGGIGSTSTHPRVFPIPPVREQSIRARWPKVRVERPAVQHLLVPFPSSILFSASDGRLSSFALLYGMDGSMHAQMVASPRRCCSTSPRCRRPAPSRPPLPPWRGAGCGEETGGRSSCRRRPWPRCPGSSWRSPAAWSTSRSSRTTWVSRRHPPLPLFLLFSVAWSIVGRVSEWIQNRL